MRNAPTAVVSSRRALHDPFRALGFSVAPLSTTLAESDRRTFLKMTGLPCVAACAAACLPSGLVVPLRASSSEDDRRFRSQLDGEGDHRQNRGEHQQD